MGRMLRSVLVIASVALWVFGQPEEPWVPVVVIIMVLITALGFVPMARQYIGILPRWLRRFPVLYWFVFLVAVIVALVLWLVPYQPTNGRLLTSAEYIYLLAALWVFSWLFTYDLNSDQLRVMGRALAQSRWSGVLVTLTTLLFILIGVEFGLRLFYITTDGYGFTAMNYHWYKNFYWGRYNTLGYRDYEPLEGADIQRVAVLGDSFAMGHGINDLNDTFPQMLEKQLGDRYDVNVIAQSGWDSDIELHYLQEYPLKPDIVVLSYYLNDIDHLLTDPTQDPDAVFDFPDNPVLSWVILNFFGPNFAYYNLMQYTSTAKATDFTARLIDAHMDDDLWARQAWWLNEIVVWTQAQDIELVVLLWPHMVAVERSVPATVRIRDFFTERGVPVVDMTPVLIDKNPLQMIVNRFDSHPGIAAQRLAADQLYAAITALNN